MRHVPEHHPCFNIHMRERYGRVHLPVAPTCNVQCLFCNRAFDCVNESRPGVTSALLSPEQAVRYLKSAVVEHPQLAVVGIAGPGDPFATPDLTIDTLERVRREFPDMLLCVASNGLAIGPHIGKLSSLDVSHVTITVNAVDPEIGKDIYRWFRDGTKVLRGMAGAKLLIERQLAAIRSCRESGIIVKVNFIVLPGINDREVETVARTVAEAGANLFNCIPLLPAPGSDLEPLGEPDPGLVKDVQEKAKRYLPQMTHCTRCRADAVGLLGEAYSEKTARALEHHALVTGNTPTGNRSRIAVATFEGILINQHLGNAATLRIYEANEKGPTFVEERTTPKPGGGNDRWHELAKLLGDCRMVLVEAAGVLPQEILRQYGIEVVIMEGFIESVLKEIFSGRPIPGFMTARAPSRGQCGKGTGCAA